MLLDCKLYLEKVFNSFMSCIPLCYPKKDTIDMDKINNLEIEWKEISKRIEILESNNINNNKINSKDDLTEIYNRLDKIEYNINNKSDKCVDQTLDNKDISKSFFI